MFPQSEAEIPARVRVDTAKWERAWLCDCEVRSWAGELAVVRSPVGVGPSLTPARVGAMPMLDRAAALEAIGAARRAWSDGRGEWPTMRVGERIERLQTFIAGMAKVRDDVIKL